MDVMAINRPNARPTSSSSASLFDSASEGADVGRRDVSRLENTAADVEFEKVFAIIANLRWPSK